MRTWNLVVVSAAVVAAGCSRSFVSPAATTSSKLTASAETPVVAPRGFTTIDVHGGSGRHHLDLAPSNTHSGSGARVDNDVSQYIAGDVGNVTDVVTVIDDGTGASVDVPIVVGPNLSITPRQLVRAPSQSWAFQVSGGQPPYFFTVDTQGSACGGVAQEVGDAGPLVCGAGPDGGAGAGSCISGTGEYVARSCGGGLDVVRVRDALDSSVDAEVSVSSQLELRPTVAQVVAGGSVLFQVTGGVPPYVFDFTRRGNRSGGAIGVAGDYTAGANSDVTDEIRVTDQVGVEQVAHVQVGAQAVQLDPDSSYELITGDFNGDGFPDVVALAAEEDGVGVQTTGASAEVLGGLTGFGEVRAFNLGLLTGDARAVAVVDLDGNGTDDLVIPRDGQVQVLLGRRDGSFDIGVPQTIVGGDDMLQNWLAGVPPGDVGEPALLLGVVRQDDGPALGTFALAGGRFVDAGVFPLPADAAVGDPELAARDDDREGRADFVTVADLEGAGTACGQSEGIGIYPFTASVGFDGSASVDFGSGSCIHSGGETRVRQAFVVRDADAVPQDAFLVAQTEGDWNLALPTPSGGFHLTPLPAPVGNDEGQVYAVNTLGLTTEGIIGEGFDRHAEVDRLDESGTLERLTILPDAGLAPRTDVPGGSIASAISVDLNQDMVDDLVVVDRAGMLRYLRGVTQGYLATGETVQVAGAGAAVATVDLDGDGYDDVLITDPALRLLWGGPGGELALGPQLAPASSAVRGLAGGQRAVWVSRVADGDAGLTLERVVTVDGGAQSETVAGLDDLDGHYRTPVTAVDVAGGDGVLVAGYALGNGGQIDAYSRGADGQVAHIDVNALLLAQADGYASFDAVFPMAVGGRPVDDLVVWYADGSGTNQLQVFASTEAGAVGWAATPESIFDLGTIAGDDVQVTAAHAFASTPGGRKDRAFLVLAHGDGSGGCEDADPTLVVLQVVGGALQVRDTLPAGLYRPCGAAAWAFGAGRIDDDAVTDLFLSDLNNFIYFQNGADGLQNGSFIDYGGTVASAAAGDFDGDGLDDIVYSQVYRNEVQVMLNHDGTFH